MTFHHYWTDPKFAQILINRHTLKEVPCFICLLGFKFTPDFNWNAHARAIAKDAGRIADSLCRCRKYPNSRCHALSLEESYLSNNVILRVLGVDEFFSTMLASHYFTLSLWQMYGRVTFLSYTNSDLHTWDPPRHVHGVKQSQSPSLIRSHFHSDSVFSRTVALWKRAPKRVLP